MPYTHIISDHDMPIDYKRYPANWLTDAHLLGMHCYKQPFLVGFEESQAINDGYTLSKRIHEIGQSEVIRNGNGFQSWTHRVGSIGNAVNPTIANYLFECIKRHASVSYGCA